MKGIIMAGGAGTRLSPITNVVNKQLLPIYDKPLIYYPITTLMLAGIRDLLVITNSSDLISYQKLIGDGTQFGITVNYAIQPSPAGIAEGVLISEKYFHGNKIAFILGDNLFYGAGLGRQLAKYADLNGAQIFAYKVANPTGYGIVTLDSKGDVLQIEEKPVHPRSDLAVTGLYFYDEKVFDMAKKLKPSARGELEITDLNKMYLEQGLLKVNILPRGTAWLDTGTFEGLHDASTFIKITQERQNLNIGHPLEAARIQGWVD
jgi:glucose-1-phosphate thymidylyltransferase